MADPSAPSDTPGEPPPARRAPSRRRRRLKRALLVLAVALPLLLGAVWYAANTVPWFGAWLADTLRAVIGTENVTRLEEIAYKIQDRWDLFWRGDERPKQYWDAPTTTTPAPPPGSAAVIPAAVASAASSAGTGAAPAPSASSFRPADVGPLFSHIAAPGDGVWVPVELPERPGEPPIVYKTLLHPDRKRPFAELFVVAIDYRRARLHPVAGKEEPRGTAPGAHAAERHGLIPAEHQDKLLLAWNGGFKEEHGHYGMMLGGVTLVRPVGWGCTITGDKEGALRIGTWKKKLDADEVTFAWWRQTPPCVVEDGKLHPALTDENTNWGAALGGDTVVRRSALALDRDRQILYMGVSNATTVRAMAVGMQHAGGHDVAQLDINYSYPRLVFFRRGESGERECSTVFPGFPEKPEEYLRKASPRDFFYLVLRDPPGSPSAVER